MKKDVIVTIYICYPFSGPANTSCNFELALLRHGSKKTTYIHVRNMCSLSSRG